MAITKEQQREKIRQEKPQVFPDKSKTIKRVIGNKLVLLTKKQNKKRNARTHKAPVVFYGHNTK